MQAVCSPIPAKKMPSKTCAPKKKRFNRLTTSLSTLAILALVTTSVQAAGRVFYDGFESGNTNLWQQGGTSNRCQVVGTGADGIAGPRAGSRMARCNWNGSVAWNDPAAFESLVLSIPYTNEFLLRLWLRPDQNLEKTGGSPTKIMRFFNWTGDTSTYLDLFGSLISGNGLKNEGTAGGQGLASYWGGKDNASNPASWHKVEYYINQASGLIKVWHDGVLVRSDSNLRFNGAKWTPFNLTSNWADAHDATNYLYFDEVEIFSDTGTGSSGSLSDATASATAAAIGGASLLRVTGTTP